MTQFGDFMDRLYIAEDLKYIDKEIAETRRDRCDLEKNSIAKLMLHLKNTNRTKQKT